MVLTLGTSDRGKVSVPGIKQKSAGTTGAFEEEITFYELADRNLT
jgi:hypothetical protein